MSKCLLNKNITYQVKDIFFNPQNGIYQLVLADKSPQCINGIFTSKHLELKISPNNSSAVLHFNQNDQLPELILNNMALVKNSTKLTPALSANYQAIQKQPQSHVSFIYLIIGFIAIFFLIRFLLRRQAFSNNLPTQQRSYLLNDGNNNQNLNNSAAMPQQGQGTSRTGSFLSGLAGGALGAVVGNELYNKFKNNDTSAQATEHTQDDSFAGDDNANYADNNESAFYDGADNSFSDDY